MICLRLIYNFLLFHANIIQLSHIFGNFLYDLLDLPIDPVPVPFFACFIVLQKIHIKQSSNAIKIHGESFWHICDFWEVESTQTGAHRAHNTPGRATGPRRALVSCAFLERRLEPFL